MKIVYISDKESYLGFEIIGVETVIVSDKDSALKYLNKFKESTKVGIILISDTISGLIKEEINDILLSRERPLILEIPSITNYQEKRKNIKDFLRETIGISV
jgi:V/A-type H+-transporting ATPase subunit F